MVNEDVSLTDLVDDEPTPLETEDVVDVQTNEDNVFKIDGSPFELPLRIKNFVSTKDYSKFIKAVERLVRYSQEYKLWTKYITDNLQENECALTGESIHEVDLEIHHHPINLYLVVKAVLDKYLDEKKEFCSYDIATDVIHLHFQNKIGYIVLLSDLHKKFHAGFLNLPIELVKGDYKYITSNYNIEETDLSKIVGYCNVTREDVKLEWSKNNYPNAIDNKSPKKSIDYENIKPKSLE